jgi:spore maturation protein CgeB
MPVLPWGKVALYDNVATLRQRYARNIRRADAVIVGSYVPQGVELATWILGTARGVRAFYDIDTPVTLAKLAAGQHEYITPELVRLFDLYLSFSGGKSLAKLRSQYRAANVRPLYCSVDPAIYQPTAELPRWDLGYLGTYSEDRQPTLRRLLIEPAKREPHRAFVVAGPQYPHELNWPANVQRIEHVAPAEHRTFYGRQKFTLNVTRADMIEAGHSPSVRLFEAAACGVPIISDRWEGIEEFLEPDREILLAGDATRVCQILSEISEEQRRAIGAAARQRILSSHTAAHRAAELERYLMLARTPSIRAAVATTSALRAASI